MPLFRLIVLCLLLYYLCNLHNFVFFAKFSLQYNPPRRIVFLLLPVNNLNQLAHSFLIFASSAGIVGWNTVFSEKILLSTSKVFD